MNCLDSYLKCIETQNNINVVKAYIAFRICQFDREIVDSSSSFEPTVDNLNYLCNVVYECVANLKDSNSYYVDECIKSLLGLIEDGYPLHDITSRSVLALI